MGSYNIHVRFDNGRVADVVHYHNADRQGAPCQCPKGQKLLVQAHQIWEAADRVFSRFFDDAFRWHFAYFERTLPNVVSCRTCQERMDGLQDSIPAPVSVPVSETAPVSTQTGESNNNSSLLKTALKVSALIAMFGGIGYLGVRHFDVIRPAAESFATKVRDMGGSLSQSFQGQWTKLVCWLGVQTTGCIN